MKYPFFNLINSKQPDDTKNYWNLNHVEDYFNSCFSEKQADDSNSSHWRITDINKDYLVSLFL